ncbi:MAG: DUF433 domain-containing protein [Candidatus Hodarchaeales archaeon]
MSDEEIELMDRIVIHPDICHGKPRIKGTRIIISIILDWLAEGASFEKIIDAYPSLTAEDIKAILNYSRKLVENQKITGLAL